MHELQQAERNLRAHRRSRGHAARNVHAEHEARLTLGERVADDLAHFVGSWPFILVFLALCALWVVLNAVLLVARAWDPYPFILLNLFLSLLAGLQAPVIMMSQNRQEARDRLRSEADYEVNLKAELEIEELHTKLNELRERQWQELLAIQQQQITLLQEQVELLRGLMLAGGAPRGEGAPPAPKS